MRLPATHGLALLVLAIAVAGCGGNTATPPATKPTATAAPTLRPVATPTPFPASAYTAGISGVVINAKTHTPIRGATITIGRKLESVRTDSRGRYTISFPAGPPVSVTVGAHGFIGSLATGALKSHQSAIVNFKLSPIVPGKPGVPSFPSTFGHP